MFSERPLDTDARIIRKLWHVPLVHILTLSRTQSLLAFWSPGQNSEVTEDWGPVGNRLPVTTRVRAIYRRSV